MPSQPSLGTAWAAEPRKPRFLGKDKVEGVHIFRPKVAKSVFFFFMNVWLCTASGCLISLSPLDLCKIWSDLDKGLKAVTVVRGKLQGGEIESPYFPAKYNLKGGQMFGGTACRASPGSNKHLHVCENLQRPHPGW